MEGDEVCEEEGGDCGALEGGEAKWLWNIKLKNYKIINYFFFSINLNFKYLHPLI
jgi:hypothetical protein